MIMLKNLEALILLQQNFTITLLIELEIICMSVCASLLLVKSLEKDSENSLLSSMNVQSIGSCLGLKRL